MHSSIVDTDTIPIDVVAVVGAGTMGRGIAQVVARAGRAVALHDADPDALKAARDAIEATLAKGVELGKVTPREKTGTLERIRIETDLGEAVMDADLVIEAIPESLAAKKELFAELDAHCPTPTILASNTSSLSISALAEATARPERVLGLHFFNPVHLMRLVEIVVHPQTDDGVRDSLRELVRGLGKTPIVATDTPGFATSRLGLVLGLEAIRMVEEGVASAADIDTALELGYNHPMGPLQLTDLVGLDVRLSIADHLADTLDRHRFAAPDLLRRMVERGLLGRKSGEGFYRWRDGEAIAKDVPLSEEET
ncbi:MAG: 3-hydroxyacyl-CoA dehydrogenase family protein [Gemmatimonadetes bacterium]|nr:3-hydroxyacyl-CoA dehydrogenase family protein [Gemmatimonadota bacterium]